jgi:hypothetical protein
MKGEKEGGRAENRHHLERLREKRKEYCGGWPKQDPRAMGRILQTPRICTCWMCKRPRYERKPWKDEE